MLVIFVTHADSRRTKEPTMFRCLTDQGREEVKRAANRFQDLAKRALADQFNQKLIIEKIVSSPKARCVETALLFADELRSFTKTSDISISNNLDEKRDGILTSKDVIAVLDAEEAQAVLVACHGDLANALPQTGIRSQEIQGGWFKQRPVVAMVDYDRKEAWERARVLFCDGYDVAVWRSLSAS